MPTKWRSYQVRLWAELDGTRIPLVSTAINWELNAVPSAVCGIAVGRNAVTGKLSAIHTVISDPSAQLPIKIYAQFASAADLSFGSVPSLNLPHDEFLIFEGFTTGMGYDRGSSNANLLLYASHWLGRLHDSAAFSAMSHPNNPSAYSFGAFAPGLGGEGAGAEQGHYTTSTMLNEFFTAANLRSDLWGEALLPFLLRFAAVDHFAAEEIGISGDAPPRNDGALEALKRMGSDVPDYVGLGLDLQLDQDLADAIISHSSIVATDPEQFCKMTLWDVIVGGFGQEFMFSVVPRITDALVVPYVPGIRTAYKIITAGEDSMLRWQGAATRPLRGVAVQAPVTCRAGLDQSLSGPNQAVLGIGGYYQGQDAGMILFKPAPRWIGEMVSFAQRADESSGGNNAVISTAIQPDSGSTNGAAELAGQKTEIQKDFLNRYAHTLYSIECLKGSQGILSGPVRFDVAPGSAVRVETTGDLSAAPGKDKLAGPLFAEVLRVSFVADAQQGQCGTSFHLAHTRSEAQNKSKIGLDAHPMYRQKFNGAPLLVR